MKTAIVILGASGDLTRRTLIPALHEIHKAGKLPECTCIVGSGRTDFSDETFRARFDASGDFARLLSYHRGIAGLREYLEAKVPFDRVVFFLSLPPDRYEETAAQIAAQRFGAGDGGGSGGR